MLLAQLRTHTCILYLCSRSHSRSHLQVSTRSEHFVSPVTPLAQGKRLAFNGWWGAAWEPQPALDAERMLEPEEKRGRGTAQQYAKVYELLAQTDAEGDRQGYERLEQLAALLPPMVGQAPIGSREAREAERRYNAVRNV